MPALTTLLFLFVLAGHPLASLVNRTIDDEYGDSITGLKPIYFPQDQWAQGANCSNCTSEPLSDLAFDSTWHVSTYFVNRMEPPSIAFSFTGMFQSWVSFSLFVHHTYCPVGFAIYVYFITVPATTLYPATHLSMGNLSVHSTMHRNQRTRIAITS